MEKSVDVLILGGSFSGASLALLLRREQPELTVLIVERAEVFDRKVGEATTEVSGEFLTKRLALTTYLAHHHLHKQGLRMWFPPREGDAFGDCAEIGANYQVRLPSFQLDREQLDSHLIALAEAEGAEVWRPARVREVNELNPEVGGEASTAAEVVVTKDGEEHRVRARWVMDASGRAAVLARKFGFHERLEEHPTNALWARFRGVKDWDGHEMRKAFPGYANSGAQASRGAATNHLTGYGWWCWIIPLKGGDFSAGLVYDSRLFTPGEGPSIGARLKAHLLSHPVGKVIFENAVPVDHDQKAYSHLPYRSTKLAGPGWQLLGDAAGFMDPLYSPGLDYCSWTVRCALGRIAAESRGESVDLALLNRRFECSFLTWFRALYLNKYHYLGDAELMSAAYLMDIGLFFLGPVRESTRVPTPDLECLPFNGPVDGAVGRFMMFYNRRLSILAQKRMAAGCYGRKNFGWSEFGDGFVPDPRSLIPVRKGAIRWLMAEWNALFLRPQALTTCEPRTLSKVGMPVPAN